MSNILKIAGAGVSAAAEETDENFNQTVLLLHGDGTNGAQNNTFLDSSSNNFTITRNPASGPNAPTQGTFSPFSAPDGRWSNYFDGAGDYINTSSTLISTTATTFTIEAWIYMTANPSTSSNIPALCGDMEGTNLNNYMSLGPLTNRTLGFQWFDGSSNNTAIGNTVMDLHTWNHIAVVVNASAISLYVNGVAQSITGTTTITNRGGSTSKFTIGVNSTRTFTGYASNIRVTSTAVYTSEFTPSTAPLTAITNTSLLTCQSNRFVDNSTNAFAITRNGDVKVTSFSPFAPTAAYDASVNGGSGYFDGNDYLTVGSSTDWKFLHDGTTAFTIQAWIYIPDATANPIVIGNTLSSAETGFAFGVANTDNSILYLISKGTSGTYGLNLESSANLKSNAWNHIAVTHDGSSNYTLYINGSSAGTGAAVGHSASNPTNNTTVAVSDSSAGLLRYLTGYIASLKISDVAESISLPTAPFTSDANTKLLLNFTNAGIFDNTGKNNLETVADAQIDTTTKKYGTGSMEFDGTGDWLLMPSTPDLNLGTGDATIECWLYITAAIQDYRMIVSENTTSNYVCLRGGGTGGRIEINVAGTAFTINLNNSISQNTWHHLAVVRSGSTFTAYVDGSFLDTGTSSAAWNYSTNGTLVGRFGGVTAYEWPGFIDDLRITKGVARYTSNFTVPDKAFPDL